MACLFFDIISGKQKKWKIYEDDYPVAFLSPFSHTPGFSGLVTREHQTSDVLALDEDRYVEFLKTARNLSHKINQKLGAKRTGLIIEGMGIDHAHIKLIPMHGIGDGNWQPILSDKKEFNEIY